MKLQADRETLRDVFTRAYRGAGKQNSFPALQGLLCDVNGDELTVTASDFDLTVTTTTQIEPAETGGDGTALIPGSLLTRGIAAMPRGTINISVVEDNGDSDVEIVGQPETSNGHKPPSYRFNLLKKEDFPDQQTKDLQYTQVSGKDLCDAIEQVAVAASTDQARPILTGVLIETLDNQEGIRLVATDSYRLAIRDLPGVGLKLDEEGLLPARGLREIRPTVSADNIKVALDEQEALFCSDRGTLRLRKIEGSFPRYKKLIPDTHPITAEINREDLLSAINRVKLVAEEHNPVKLSFQKNKVMISATRQGVGGGSEELDCHTTINDPDPETNPDDVIVNISFNPGYLYDGVRAVGDSHTTVRMNMIDGFKPSVIDGGEDSSYLYLLMPVRT